jgi:CubicO group peptidase (beta-lactamase class C family)
VRQLLNHTAGITNDYAAETQYLGRRLPFSAQQMIDSVAGNPLGFQPGEQFTYSNTGYYLLGLVIERVSDKSYSDFLKERIFTPSRMRSTQVNELETIIPNRASGYAVTRRGALRNNDYMDASWAYSAGALVSSAADMGKWDAALYANEFLPDSRQESMWTPAKLNDGSTVDWVGLGWGISTKPPYGREITHFGQTPGFVAGIARWIDQRLTIIVLANKEEVPSWDIVAGVSALYLPRLNDPVVEDKEPELTRLHEQLLVQAVAGQLQPPPFAENRRKGFFPAKAKQLQSELQGLGTIKSFVLHNERIENSGKDRHRDYRAVFSRDSLRFQVELDENGKIRDRKVAYR